MKCGVFEDEHYYICHDGRELRHIRTETKEQDGYTQTYEVYGCADCSGCPHKEKCLYKYNAEKDAGKNKVMKVNERWEGLKEETNANIQSEKGILNRQIRSIQTEGHFGDIKENEKFRRFNYRSTEKVYKEFMLYAIGRNINKCHWFIGGNKGSAYVDGLEPEGKIVRIAGLLQNVGGTRTMTAAGPPVLSASPRKKKKLFLNSSLFAK